VFLELDDDDREIYCPVYEEAYDILTIAAGQRACVLRRAIAMHFLTYRHKVALENHQREVERVVRRHRIGLTIARTVL